MKFKIKNREQFMETKKTFSKIEKVFLIYIEIDNYFATALLFSLILADFPVLSLK